MSKPGINRQYVINERPKGDVNSNTFKLIETALPPLKEGEVLLQNEVWSFDPAQRVWITEESYMPVVPIGGVVPAITVAKIVESNNPAVGDHVSGFHGWQDYKIFNPATAGPFDKPNPVIPGVPLSWNLGTLGITGLTAYFGLAKIEPKAGETIIISGAAGATGNVVGQIAKIKGCRVIGIAGGKEKCDVLTKELGFDHAVDYKSEDVRKRLAELVPKGAEMYFDNVGGSILEDAIENMAPHGRILFCGSISGYNSGGNPGPRNYTKILLKRLEVKGFMVSDHLAEAAKGIGELATWTKEGKLKVKEDHRSGFENLPKTFTELFSGGNVGKLVLTAKQ